MNYLTFEVQDIIGFIEFLKSTTQTRQFQTIDKS